MLYLAPLQNEFHASYLGRLIESNGLPTDHAKALKVMKAIAIKDGVPIGQAMDVIPLLAFYANMPIPQFVRCHTLGPYRRAFVSHKSILIHGDPNNLDLLRQGVRRTVRDGAYLCPECVKQDAANGMSYWRRNHQLPGMHICTNHGTPLRYMDSEEAFHLAPSECLAKSHLINQEWATQWHTDPFVTKFVNLAELLSEAEKPFRINTIRKVLTQRASEMGLSISARTTDLLSDRIVASFPKRWLECLFPGVTVKEYRVKHRQLDGVLYSSTTVSTSVDAYLLAISIMFESPQEALKILHAASEHDL